MTSSFKTFYSTNVVPCSAYNNWLVVSTPLKHMSLSVGMIIPSIWKIIKFMFQTTNQINTEYTKNFNNYIYIYTVIDILFPLVGWLIEGVVYPFNNRIQQVNDDRWYTIIRWCCPALGLKKRTKPADCARRERSWVGWRANVMFGPSVDSSCWVVIVIVIVSYIVRYIASYIVKIYRLVCIVCIFLVVL